MDDIATLERKIEDAPFYPESWPSVLVELAAMGGGWSAQVFGICGGRFVIDVVGGYTSDLSEELNRQGGADPTVSPRPGALMRTRPKTLICDGEYLSARDRDRYPIYRDFYERVDGHYCTNALLQTDRVIMGLAVNHSDRQGPPDSLRKQKLTALLPALERAVALQIRLENHAASLALHSLDAIKAPAVLCDLTGAIVEATPRARQMLAEGDMVIERGGRLCAAERQSDQRLNAALVRAASCSETQTVLLLNANGSGPGLADIVRLGGRTASLAARLLVVLGDRSDKPITAAFCEMGLTPAEADVAQRMLQGQGVLSISRARGVSVETVRFQSKAVYAKLGVSGQAELIERFRNLL